MSNSDWLAVLGLGFTALSSLLGSITFLVWWLGKQFSSTRGLMYEKIDTAMSKILEKLDYHEKHDDQRFAALGNDMWSIRLRNAARDRDILDEQKTLPI